MAGRPIFFLSSSRLTWIGTLNHPMWSAGAWVPVTTD
jgi:hypothetical protein